MGIEHNPGGVMARYREKREQETQLLNAVLDAPLTDDGELRSWLGSQDVVGTRVTTQIAGVIHAVLRLRDALVDG